MSKRLDIDHEDTMTASIIGLAQEDYSSVSDLYLNPETPALYVLPRTDGVTMRVWERRDERICSIPANAINDDVARAVTALRPKIDALVAAYQGLEWDGSQYRARWGDKGDMPDVLDVQCYWDAELWLEPVEDEIIKMSIEGCTPADILAEYGTGDQDNGFVHRDEALARIEQIIDDDRSRRDEMGIDE